MEKISGRRVHVTKYSDHISLMLVWYIEIGDKKFKVHDKFIRLDNVSMFQQVEQAINTLVRKWTHVFFQDNNMSLVSDCLDGYPELFDCVADSDITQSTLLETLAQKIEERY